MKTLDELVKRIKDTVDYIPTIKDTILVVEAIKDLIEIGYLLDIEGFLMSKEEIYDKIKEIPLQYEVGDEFIIQRIDPDTREFYEGDFSFKVRIMSIDKFFMKIMDVESNFTQKMEKIEFVKYYKIIKNVR